MFFNKKPKKVVEVKTEQQSIILEEKKESRTKLSTHQGIRIVQESLEWYKERYRQSVQINIIQGYLNMAFLICFLCVFIFKPTPIYYAVTPDLRVMEMSPLSEPYITEDNLSNWLAQAITSTLSLDFKSWKTQLTKAKSFYDSKAFDSLVVSMKNNNILELIEGRRLVTSVMIQNSPIVVASGMQDGKYMWKLECAIQLTYESTKGIEYTQKLQATALVQRTNTLEYSSGINIKQLVLATQ